LSISLPKLNERLIAKVLEHIKAFPESYNQNIVSVETEVTKKTPCGAIGCFGGWAVLLTNPKSQRPILAASEIDLSEAKELVGLTSEEGEYLFDVAEGNSKRDYKTIVGRLNNIRAAREVASQKGVTSVSYDTSDGWTLNYSD
jgi:hypothetical protein